jgi:phage protein U
MGEVLVALGPFLFFATAPSFEKLKFNAEFRVQPQNRLGRDVAQQFLGPGVRSVDLDGVMYPQEFGGEGLLSGIHAAARAGAVLPLIAMSDAGLQGDVFGLWMVKHLQNTRSFFNNTGPRKIEFSIKLDAYGEDSGGLFGLF